MLQRPSSTRPKPWWFLLSTPRELLVTAPRKRRVFPFTAVIGQEEMKLALQECGRKLGTYLRRRKQMKKQQKNQGKKSPYCKK